MALRPPVDADAIAGLCADARTGLAGRAVVRAWGADPRLAARATLVCDVSALDRLDVTTLDALARLALTGRRAHVETMVRGAPAALRAMLWFSGLEEAIRCELDGTDASA